MSQKPTASSSAPLPPKRAWVKRARSRRKTCSGSRGDETRVTRGASEVGCPRDESPPRGSETRGKRTHVSTLFFLSSTHLGALGGGEPE